MPNPRRAIKKTRCSASNLVCNASEYFEYSDKLEHAGRSNKGPEPSHGTRDALVLDKVGKQEEIASCHSYTVLNADTRYQQPR